MGIVELLYRQFDRSKIDLNNEFPGWYAYQSGSCSDDGTILVLWDQPEEGKLHTVLHELLHMDTRYGAPFSKCVALARFTTQKYEDVIEQEVKWIEENRPILVEYLRYRLGFANTYERDVLQPMRDRCNGQQYLFQP